MNLRLISATCAVVIAVAVSVQTRGAAPKPSRMEILNVIQGKQNPGTPKLAGERKLGYISLPARSKLFGETVVKLSDNSEPDNNGEVDLRNLMSPAGGDLYVEDTGGNYKYNHGDLGMTITQARYIRESNNIELKYTTTKELTDGVGKEFYVHYRIAVRVRDRSN